MTMAVTEEKLMEKIEALKNKEIYHKLKRFEKKELKSLRKQLNQIKEEKMKHLRKMEEEKVMRLKKLEEEKKMNLKKLEEEKIP